MKGDFTRDTFDSFRHFSRVLMQQGRVQLDADFNEQAAILLHYLRTLATDLIGPYGGPNGENLGFAIEFPPQGNDGNFTIGKGRYYVDGILCENDQDLQYLDQEYLKYLITDKKGKLLPANPGIYYAYLDVWERHITHIQDESIREVALGVGGPDTCTRAMVVWQVKLVPISDATCENATQWVKDHPKLSNASMKVRVRPEGEYESPCSIPPESRYRGLENQLYRIETHREGTAWNGQENSDGTPAGNAASAATFKWSRDNGSVVFPIVRQQGNVVTLQSLGRDQRTSLKQDDWVEITDDGTELRGEPGILAQVDKVDSVEMTVTLKDPGVPWPLYDEKSLSHPLLRRWDQRAIEGLVMSEGAILISENVWIEIEDGIEVQFQLLGGEYRTGDYWLVPARVATGKIEWPPELNENGQVIKDQRGNELPKALPPHGIEHHYAPLAVIEKLKVISDCRCPIKPPCPKESEA